MLLGTGHETQDQFPCHQAFHQTFWVGEIVLASPWSAVRLRLRQMQRSRHRPGPFPPLPKRLPVLFQSCPNRFPILCGGLHHHFLNLLLNQPSGQ